MADAVLRSSIYRADASKVADMHEQGFVVQH